MDTSTILLILGVSIFVVIILYIGYRIGVLFGEERAKRKFNEMESAIRKDAISRSRAVLCGQFSEQLAPYLPDFPYKPTEVRFIGKPIDFIVFKGLDEKEPSEVVFVEVKSGKSRLSGVEKKLKDAVENKRVSWEEYRIPD
ncbi:hypothetical protein BEH94_11125 [Candidatus Altiarchaeales archaeon WOR_SM1_SCG]|nr:hypothetical protein BEH94_11125 [Candidatus Altiarchaeales archaeon WOR_SM1_SCG]